MLTREERAKLRCEYSYPAHPASRLVTSLLDHADEQDAIIEQLRQAVGRLSLKARAALAARR